MNTENRNLHQEIHELIENRPWAFGHLYPQKAYRLIFILLGMASFIYSIYASIRLYLFMETAKSLTDSANSSLHLNLSSKTQKDIIEAIIPYHLREVIIFIFLTGIFFVLARYAHKTIKRNLYILELEDIIKSSRMYDVVNPPKTESQNAKPDTNDL